MHLNMQGMFCSAPLLRPPLPCASRRLPRQSARSIAARPLGERLLHDAGSAAGFVWTLALLAYAWWGLLPWQCCMPCYCAPWCSLRAAPVRARNPLPPLLRRPPLLSRLIAGPPALPLGTPAAGSWASAASRISSTTHLMWWQAHSWAPSSACSTWCELSPGWTEWWRARQRQQRQRRAAAPRSRAPRCFMALPPAASRCSMAATALCDPRGYFAWLDRGAGSRKHGQLLNSTISYAGQAVVAQGRQQMAQRSLQPAWQSLVRGRAGAGAVHWRALLAPAMTGSWLTGRSWRACGRRRMLRSIPRLPHPPSARAAPGGHPHR